MEDETLLELQDYANREGTELGELWQMLIELWEGYSIYMSPEFGQHLENEIEVSLEEARRIFSDEFAEVEQTPLAESLSHRITEYLEMGGLFNPESVDHEKVRDLLIDCRELIDDKGKIL